MLVQGVSAAVYLFAGSGNTAGELVGGGFNGAVARAVVGGGAAARLRIARARSASGEFGYVCTNCRNVTSCACGCPVRRKKSAVTHVLRASVLSMRSTSAAMS